MEILFPLSVIRNTSHIITIIKGSADGRYFDLIATFVPHLLLLQIWLPLTVTSIFFLFKIIYRLILFSLKTWASIRFYLDGIV